VKRLVRPGIGFRSFHAARRTLAGYEAKVLIRKGQVRNIGGRDMRAKPPSSLSYSRVLTDLPANQTICGSPQSLQHNQFAPTGLDGMMSHLCSEQVVGADSRWTPWIIWDFRS
jgi:hypothetical protein